MMKLPWIQVSFECCHGIQTPYMDKNCWCVYGRTDARDVCTCLDKKGADSRGRNTIWIVYDYRGQSWHGL